MNAAACLFSLLLLVLVGCDPPKTVASRPLAGIAAGQWHYDSTSATVYNRRHQIVGRLDNPMTGTALAIDTAAAEDGTVREYRQVARYGQRLLVRGSGQNADTVLIALMNAHHLVLQDSMCEPSGSMTRVWREYYSH